MKNFFFTVIFFVSLSAFAQNNSKLILGTWVYSDLYQKEKVDADTKKMAQTVFSTMEMLFTAKTITMSVMGKSEEISWKFSKANPKIIEATSKTGKKINMEIISLTKDKLVMKMGAAGSLIMKKKV